MVLPPQFDGDDGHEGYSHYDEYDTEIWYDQKEADEALHVMEAYMAGTQGFTALQMMDMIIDVRDVKYNDDGELISFEFDFESADGDYSGYGYTAHY